MPVDVGFHWVMLNDYDRNAAYRAAIRRSAPGRIVYDLGAGVGPMSYYALAAGARRLPPRDSTWRPISCGGGKWPPAFHRCRPLRLATPTRTGGWRNSR